MNNETTKQRITDGKCLVSITQYDLANIESIDVAEFHFTSGDTNEFTIEIKTKAGQSLSLTANVFSKRNDTATRYDDMTEENQAMINTDKREHLILF